MQEISILSDIKVIIFDLDDTLYYERTFVYSGFRAVAQHFSKAYHIDREEHYELMLNELNTHGRGKVFDKSLQHYNIYTKTTASKSLSIYRTHKPNINLLDESIEILDYYNNKNIPLYIVTDGNKVVQANKIAALGLDKYIKKAFITHRYGIKNAKPSTYCFEKIANLEQVPFNKIVYIGDNINKDFVNIKKLGFQTIQVKQGMFKNSIRQKKYQADIQIYSLLDLKDIIF